MNGSSAYTKLRRYEAVYQWNIEDFVRILELFDKTSTPMHISSAPINTELHDSGNELIEVLPSDTSKAVIEYMRSSKEDFTFILNNERISAWKSILIARSPVFSAMLSHEMKENVLNEAVITDIEPEVFKIMLEFINTDENIPMDGLEADVLAVAEKYQLLRLKSMCEEALHRKITVKSALGLLVLADVNNAQQLLACVIDYFKTNTKAIVEQPDFEVFSNAHPALMFMLVRKLAG